MQPEISEFSYGFALTNEIVGWVSLSAAPVFPSLIEEGKAGGGYDVKLDKPGVALFLQFKRSHYMVRRTAQEHRNVAASGGTLNVPYYRFPITEASTSDQHELLLALDNGSNLVFYAAPRFHQLSEINQAWKQKDVARRSLFVAPSTIGSLDNTRHCVAFDSKNSWLCSEPRTLEVLTSRGLEDKIQGFLRENDRPLRERLSSLVVDMRQAERRGRENAELRRAPSDREGIPTVDTLAERYFTLRDALAGAPPESEPPISRAPAPLNGEASVLRETADIATHVFETQMVVVQPR